VSESVDLTAKQRGAALKYPVLKLTVQFVPDLLPTVLTILSGLNVMVLPADKQAIRDIPIFAALGLPADTLPASSGDGVLGQGDDAVTGTSK
jgi:hypothetical protein